MSRAPTTRRGCRALAALAALALAACTGVPDGVQPVRGFDAARYQGTWYSVHRLDHSFERNLTNVTARYAILPNGRVEVVNRGFDRRECRWKQVVGTARFLGDPDIGSLGVSFFGPFTGGYHVAALDAESYRWSMVSGPNHDYLWILAREPRLDPAVREQLFAQARAAGFPVEELQTVDHGPPACADGTAPPPEPTAGRAAPATPPPPV